MAARKEVLINQQFHFNAENCTGQNCGRVNQIKKKKNTVTLSFQFIIEHDFILRNSYTTAASWQ